MAATILTCRKVEVVGVKYDVDSLQVGYTASMRIGRLPSLELRVSTFSTKETLKSSGGHVPGLVIEVTASGWWEQ